MKAGQVLGVQDVSALVTSAATNPDTLANSAGSIIEDAEIRSPIDGQVVQNDVINGQVVSPSTEVATIADTSHFYIQANVEETSILRIRQGQVVDVHIDAYPHRSFKGYVESIEPVTQTAFSPLPNLNTSGTYSKVTQLIPVKIDVTDAGNLTLMLGMNAEVKIHLNPLMTKSRSSFRAFVREVLQELHRLSPQFLRFRNFDLGPLSWLDLTPVGKYQTSEAKSRLNHHSAGERRAAADPASRRKLTQEMRFPHAETNPSVPGNSGNSGDSAAGVRSVRMRRSQCRGGDDRGCHQSGVDDDA